MIFELIATVVAGFAAGGIAALLLRFSRGALPRWIVPVAAGAAMISFAIWSEYSWFGRTSAALPDDFVIVSQSESSAPWRPWTYVRPMVDRFAAVDTGSVGTNEAFPEMRIAETYFWTRWAAVARLTVAFDCADGRRAPMVEGVEIADDGSIVGAEWVTVPADDPSLSAVCPGG
jgi:hypothetical protein